METQSATDTAAAPTDTAAATATVAPKTQEELKTILNALRKGEDVEATNEDMKSIRQQNPDVVQRLTHEEEYPFKNNKFHYFIESGVRMINLKCKTYHESSNGMYEGINRNITRNCKFGDDIIINEKDSLGYYDINEKIVWQVKKIGMGEKITGKIASLFNRGGRKSRNQRKSRKSRKSRKQRKSRRSRR